MGSVWGMSRGLLATESGMSSVLSHPCPSHAAHSSLPSVPTQTLFSDFNFLRPGSVPAPRVPTPVHTPRPPHGPRSPRSVDTGMLGHSPRNASRSWFCVLPSRPAATSDMKEQVTVTGQHLAGTWSSGVRKVLSSPHFTEVARRVQAGGPGLA